MMIRKSMKLMAMAALTLSLALAWMQHASSAESVTDMPGMDHGSMGHGSALPSQADEMKGTDHSKMNHDAGAHDDDMPQAGHTMSDAGVAITEARDPNAYSGGYDFSHMPKHKMADEAYLGGLLVDRLENVRSHDDSFNAYELQGSFGKDYDRLVLKAEGEADDGVLHEGRTELLWSHALAAFWDAQLGLRYDSGLPPDREWLALGVQGIAPYWFEMDATAYIGEQGRTALRFGAEYELLLTQRLILQPRAEVNLYGQQDAARELGSGLTSLTTGIRLRYEIFREFAPYVGVEWQGKYGETANFARAAGERNNETRIIAGVRFWY